MGDPFQTTWDSLGISVPTFASAIMRLRGLLIVFILFSLLVLYYVVSDFSLANFFAYTVVFCIFLSLKLSVLKPKSKWHSISKKLDWIRKWFRSIEYTFSEDTLYNTYISAALFRTSQDRIDILLGRWKNYLFCKTNLND